ncbi:MAG TPA: PH domain-containing protein [Natronosporangium sp.]|nr:PH domain-containing protein [Natronosporangium sp.]
MTPRPGLAGVEPRRRLHPLSPLLHSAKMLAALVAVISFQGAAQLGWRGFLGTLVVGMCVVTAYSVVTWLVTGYHVVGRELRIYDGVLVRRTRAIPLERLQAVDVVRPLMARLTGLAELRLEVVGGRSAEAPLAFLTVADAAALRRRLLTLAAQAGAPAGATVSEEAGPAGAEAPPGPSPGETPAGPPPPAPEAPPMGPAPTAAAHPSPPVTPQTAVPQEQHLHTVDNRDVVIGQILTPQVIFLPLAMAAVVAQYLLGAEAWSFVVLASMVAAVIGVLQQPIRRVFSDWNFRVALQVSADHHPSLRVRHGLTETRSQTVPLRRVQAVGMTWPWLWRRRGWLRCQLDVAGYSPTNQGQLPHGRLLPVGNLATAQHLVATVLPTVDITTLPLTGVPKRARWLAPWRQPVLAAGLTDQVFAARDGRITRRLVVVPLVRVQSVRLSQGPLQRLLGLATVHVDTAGALSGTAPHRPLDQARWLAAELTHRSRLARQAEHSEAQSVPASPPAPPADPGPPATDATPAN